MKFDYNIAIATPKAKELMKMKNWCKEQFGERFCLSTNVPGRWTVVWNNRVPGEYYIWYFKREQDAALFALRWV